MVPTGTEDEELENLTELFIDETPIEFFAAAIVRSDEAAAAAATQPWSLLVTEPSIPLPRGGMDVLAVIRSGAIYAGRGEWKDQRVSRDRGLRTDLVHGIEDLRIGDVSQLEGGTARDICRR
jgi:hypothetical protein